MECKSMITFKITIPKIKYEWTSPKELKNLAIENYKTLIKENEDNSKERYPTLLDWNN